MIQTATTRSLLLAVAIMSGGEFLFAIQDAIIKEMSGGYPVHQILMIRGLVAIPLLPVLIHFTHGIGILRHHDRLGDAPEFPDLVRGPGFARH